MTAYVEVPFSDVRYEPEYFRNFSAGLKLMRTNAPEEMRHIQLPT